MKQQWGYRETALAERIDAHKKYAKYEINDWILKIVSPKKGENILDVGCGDGKQAIVYAKRAGDEGVVIGADVSKDLLEKAEKGAKEANVKLRLIKHDANSRFDFESNFFDVVSCCFVIFYLTDVEKFFLKVKRILKKGGRIFIASPTVNNAKEMIRLHSKVTGKKVPQFREKRTRDVIIPLIKKHFKNVKISIFNNPVTFPSTQAFLDYYKSTLLLKESSKSKKKRDVYVEKMKKEVDKIVARKGSFVLRKQVYGILGYM